METPFKVPFKTSRLIVLFIYGFMLSLLCVAVILGGFLDDGLDFLLIQLLGVFGLLVILPMMFYLLISLITKKPAFIIADEGITDQSQIYATSFIKWDQIEKITIGSNNGVDFLYITLYDANLLMRKTKGVKRLFLFMIASISPVHSHLDLTRLEITEEELMYQLDVYSKGRFNTDTITEENVEEWEM